MRTKVKKIKKENKREFFYDILRIIAIFGVLYNHRPCFDLFASMNCLSIKGIILIIFSMISRCGPPLFFMISGALLLNKEENFKKIFTHRIIKIIIVMIIISMIQTMRIGNHTLEYFVNHLFNMNNWYLYAYLGYLFMLPFLRKIALHSTEKDKYLFLVLTTLFYTTSMFFIEFFSNTNFALFDSLQIYSENWASNCWHIIFPLLGYFSYSIMSTNDYRNKFSSFVSIGTLISTILCVIFIAYDIKNNQASNLEQIRQHFILLPCVFIFISTYHFVELYQKKINPTIIKIFEELSLCTFGVFLIEVNSSYSAQIYYNLDINVPINNPFALSILSILIEFLVYTLVIYFLRRIKFMRRIL